MTDPNPRTSGLPIHPMFLERWSPRAFTGEPISEVELLTMLEAGRWAASSYNAQPWRFVYARKDSPNWQKILELLIPTNQVWAKSASALMVLVSKKTMVPPGKDEAVDSYTHSLDAGAASAYFALQASLMGWHVHGMQGLDMARAAIELNVPSDYRVEAAYAVGQRGDPATLPEALQVREHPNDRVPLAKIAFEGVFKPN